MGAGWLRFGFALVGLPLGALLLWLAFRGTPVAQVRDILTAGDWGLPAALALASTAAFVVAKTLRWQLLLGTSRSIEAQHLYPPVLSGLALNALLPHSGEFVRAASLQRRFGAPPSAVLRLDRGGSASSIC